MRLGRERDNGAQKAVGGRLGVVAVEKIAALPFEFFPADDPKAEFHPAIEKRDRRDRHAGDNELEKAIQPSFPQKRETAVDRERFSADAGKLVPQRIAVVNDGAVLRRAHGAPSFVAFFA